MSGEDLTSSRVRRMLPSVSEVLKELTVRAPIEPEIAFRAAREVCAEELKRIRDAGGDSVPLEDLVQRAFLLATGAGLSEAPASPSPPFVPPSPPVPEPAAVADTTALDGSPEGEDPFSETTGAMDLRWDRDGREPFSETPVAGAPSESELPGEVETAEESPRVPLLFETEPTPIGLAQVPISVVLPAEEESASAKPEPETSGAFTSEPDLAEGPGNETLTRLSREAESMDLNAVFPRGPAPAAVPFALASDDGRGHGPESRGSGPEPIEDDEDTVLTIPRGGRSGRGGEEGGPRAGLILGTVVVLIALAGLGYLLVGLWLERSAAPPPVAVARRQPVASPAPAPPSMPALVPAAETAETPAPAPAPAPVAEATPPPAEATAFPTPVTRAAPSPSRGFAPAPVPVSTAPVPPAQATVPARQSRDGLIVTKDRAGQAQVFSIHFTSYKDRASAERDLKRIQGLVGREGYVAEVDLGEKGVWQRVLVGAFATAQDAKTVRAELAAKGTRDLGWVYRVVGPEAPERR